MDDPVAALVQDEKLEQRAVGPGNRRRLVVNAAKLLGPYLRLLPKSSPILSSELNFVIWQKCHRTTGALPGLRHLEVRRAARI